MHVWKCDTVCLAANTSIYEILEFSVSTKTRSKNKKEKIQCENIPFSNATEYTLHVPAVYAFQCTLLHFMDGFDLNSDATSKQKEKIRRYFLFLGVYLQRKLEYLVGFDGLRSAFCEPTLSSKNMSLLPFILAKLLVYLYCIHVYARFFTNS